jgi:triphosphoribosyl-dephospho-CoA synthase
VKTVDPITSPTIAECATSALLAELGVYPKPGLVSFIDSGSHTDMDASTFETSIRTLKPFFEELSQLEQPEFTDLQQIGIRAERAMLTATHGINTHRGAIFSLGLLISAAGIKQRRSFSSTTLGEIVKHTWGSSVLKNPSRTLSHGSAVQKRFGFRGAREEAALGFPHLYEVGLPAMRNAFDQGCELNSALVHCFFTLLSKLPDTNLLHRGGTQGLEFAHTCGRSFLKSGSVFDPAWKPRATKIHSQFVEKNLSPGGCADLLSATYFVHLIDQL